MSSRTPASGIVPGGWLRHGETDSGDEGRRPDPPASSRGPRSPGLLPSGWPLRALYLGFPLWWVLGLANFIMPITAVLMAARHARGSQFRLPSGVV